jgi:hypothetical protein
MTECEGGCVDHGGHRGNVSLCKVTHGSLNWGRFYYCETAQAIDRNSGLDVQVIQDVDADPVIARQSTDETLIAAMRELGRTVQSDDGVAALAITEAAERLEALSAAIGEIRDAVLNERFQLAEAGLDSDQVNAVLGIIDDCDPRVLEGGSNEG